MNPGEVVGAYRAVSRLGSGGMGEVWLVEHTLLGRRAAIKLLHPSFSSRPEIVARFFNEARAATAIADAGIVQVFDFGHHVDGTAYIAMELLTGESLQRRCERVGPLAISDATRIARQVASSLGAAHAHGIVHRDLKPDNIFLVRDSEVVGGERAKILDFGIAKLTNDTMVKTQTSAVMGTPTFMSPEQCRGAGAVDQRSDIYSLGCVLFTLVAGTPPFDAEGAGEIIAMHLREPAPLLSSLRGDVTHELDAICARCLAKDPNARFQSATDLALALGQLSVVPSADLVAAASRLASSVSSVPVTMPLAQTTLSLATSSTGAVLPSSTVSRRWMLPAGGAVIAAIATITAIGITHRDGSPAEVVHLAAAPESPARPLPPVHEPPPDAPPARQMPPADTPPTAEPLPVSAAPSRPSPDAARADRPNRNPAPSKQASPAQRVHASASAIPSERKPPGSASATSPVAEAKVEQKAQPAASDTTSPSPSAGSGTTAETPAPTRPSRKMTGDFGLSSAELQVVTQARREASDNHCLAARKDVARLRSQTARDVVSRDTAVARCLEGEQK